MASSGIEPGDWVIYLKQKSSTSPGPRAQQVVPSAKGESYIYAVEKFWVVERVLEGGQIQLRTRRGKQLIVVPDDPRLRKARWWERWLYDKRFRAVEAANTGSLPVE